MVTIGPVGNSFVFRVIPCFSENRDRGSGEVQLPRDHYLSVCHTAQTVLGLVRARACLISSDSTFDVPDKIKIGV